MATRASADAVTIRPATEADVDDIAAIERAVFKDPWSRRSFADLVNASNVLFLVALDNEAVVGYAVVLSSGVESELANLAVGGNWPGMPDATTPFPGYMDIDYIRVYQRK